MVPRCYVLAGFLLLMVMATAAQAWEPVESRLTTPWTKDVSPQNALPEYPRPQMVRDRWQNLNGLWQYAIRPATDERPAEWDGEILVPFAVESALSGVKKPVQPDQRLWYRRTFDSPAKEGERLLLHFGAVDWKCTVWVNGKQVGEHTGGHVPFAFDITDALNKNGENELVVGVTDPTDTGTQPRGKQVLNPRGIFYTAVTGIWQTVWLEPVPAKHIAGIKLVPDADRNSVLVTVNGPESNRVRLSAARDDQSAGNAEGSPGKEIELVVANPELWSPEHPTLYDLKIELLDGDQVVDSVQSYFGLRKIEVKKDAQGVNRLWLNNKVVFQYGLLDQGWWPDGLLTAPTDDGLKFDIELTKRLGFNMARKHVKVEPARWYYWCDKLGLLVWQDMPSGDVQKTDESRAGFRQEWKEEIDALRNSPAIVMWIPFNEGWGQHETEAMAAWTKQYDPSRPVNESSGWHDKGSGDVADMHNYPGPGMREPEDNRVSVLGEFGGLGMPVRGHTWQDEKNWGYVSYDTKEALTDAYIELVTAMRPLIARGLSAAVYTQTTDVEIEVNGLITYDREVVKMDEPRIVAANKRLYEAPPEVQVLMPSSVAKPQTWRYTVSKPADGWEKPGFDDKAWKQGSAGFGAGQVRGAVTRTPWKSQDIWLRRTFNVENPKAGKIALSILNDEEAKVYINGKLVKTLSRPIKDYQLEVTDAEAAELLRQGENTIAVHCHQTQGAQYIDVGVLRVAD